MSFLNPVNEPVKRFKSTDAGAPQINYNARAAGDIKAVLKACLVTGYGAKASAGWSIVNEADHVAEFVSPSVAMIDYRLAINDSGASSTTWYYYYQDSVVNPQNNAISKYMPFIDKLNSDNGWQLIASERGIVFVEVVTLTAVNKLGARITYFGNIKSNLIDDTGINLAFWSVGVGSPIGTMVDMLHNSAGMAKCHYKLATRDPSEFAASNLNYHKTTLQTVGGIFSSEMLSDMFLTWNYQLIAQQPAVLLRTPTSVDLIYGVFDSEINARPVLNICVGTDNPDATTSGYNSKPIAVYLDYWEY